MAQITAGLIAEFKAHHMEGAHAPMTIGEEEQLVHAWEQLAAAQEELARLRDISSYINAANISAADMPHVVVEKLQTAIDAARGEQG